MYILDVSPNKKVKGKNLELFHDFVSSKKRGLNNGKKRRKW